MPSFLRPDELFNPVRKEQNAHLVVVASGRKREHTGDFRRQFTDSLIGGGKVTGSTQVHCEKNGQLPLFPELLDERGVHAGGHIPVDGANIVAGGILTHLVEVHTLPLEGAMVGTSQGIRDHTPRPDFNLPDLTQHFAGAV